MQFPHRRCAQQALQYARLISHSHASTAATANVQESAAPSLESLRTRLAEGECLMSQYEGDVPQCIDRQTMRGVSHRQSWALVRAGLSILCRPCLARLSLDTRGHPPWRILCTCTALEGEDSLFWLLRLSCRTLPEAFRLVKRILYHLYDSLQECTCDDAVIGEGKEARLAEEICSWRRQVCGHQGQATGAQAAYSVRRGSVSQHWGVLVSLLRDFWRSLLFALVHKVLMRLRLPCCALCHQRAGPD